MEYAINKHSWLLCNLLLMAISCYII